MVDGVYHADETSEYFFHEGCHILEILNDLDHPELSIARARVAPGVRTRPHQLKGTFERYLIQSGQGRVFLGGNHAGIEVQPGSLVVIPPGTTQSIQNEGTEDLIFLALCCPRFEETNYRAVD